MASSQLNQPSHQDTSISEEAQPKIPIDRTKAVIIPTFHIESLTPEEWQQEHQRQRSELGDSAYFTLRKSELDQKSEKIGQYVVANQMIGPPKNSVAPNRMGMSGGREFRIGQGVPEQVTNGLYEILFNEIDGDQVEEREIPEEFLQYEISREELERERREWEESVRRSEEDERSRILSGKWSVRDLKAPKGVKRDEEGFTECLLF